MANLQSELLESRKVIADLEEQLNELHSRVDSVAINELSIVADLEAARVKVRALESRVNSKVGRIASRLAKGVRKRLERTSVDDSLKAKLLELKLFDDLFYAHRYPEILDTGLEPIDHFLKVGAQERKDPSGLFDTRFYLSQIEDDKAVSNALLHYLQVGAAAKLNPNPLFDSKWYVSANPEASENPLSHFIIASFERHLSPGVLFDSAYYAQSNKDVAESSINPLEHYLLSGSFEGRNPFLLFDAKQYMRVAGLKNKPFFYVGSRGVPDSVARFYAQACMFLRRDEVLINPLLHYLHNGEKEGLAPHLLFSPLYYREANRLLPDASPLRHFLSDGRRANSKTHPLFDPQYYLDNNKDVRDANIDALYHFLTNGFKEKRNPSLLFDIRFYLEKNADVQQSGANPLLHFISSGASEGRNPSEDFDVSYYAQEYEDDIAGENPLTHYVLVGAAKNYHRVRPTALVEEVELEIVAPESIEFKTLNDQVDVSIVIPSYKQNDFTLRCLKSLSEHRSRYQFEVIVVDDCSPDDTKEKLSGIQGLNYFRNEVNQGFVMTCNRGARESRGEYVIFLNNDTIVLDGWLDELIDTFYTHPRAGLVGSKLIYPDGELQDAGGIVYSDGDAANFGRDDKPDKPEYNYVRSVDYCTGAALAIRRELFLRVGSFGEEFRPIYWEDVDLAFKVREAGFDCLYQPFSVCIHFEGVTCGRNTNTGLKQSQVINQKKFGEKWKSQLVAQPLHTSKPFIEWNRSNRKKVLFVTCLTPHADRDAGSTLVIEWLQTFKDLNYDVTFFPTSLSHEGHYTEHLQKMGVKCLYTPFVKTPDEYLSNLKDEYDLIVICRIEVIDQYFDLIKKQCPRAKIVFQTIDLHYLRTQREAEILFSEKLAEEARKLKEQEIKAIKAADMSIVVSPYEVEVLSREIPNPKAICIPFSTQLDRAVTPFNERRDIVFVGGYGHQPNADAVVYFVQEVFPIIKKELPEVRFFIIGGGATTEVKKLASFDVIVTGMVEDLNQYLAFAKLSVAPLRFGAGLKGKILSSLGAGLPCITSSLGVEGTGLTNGQEIIVADAPAEFAAAVVALYRDEERWNSIADAGFEFVEKNFSPQTIAAKITELMVNLGIESKS